jgi:hypothetical protein
MSGDWRLNFIVLSECFLWIVPNALDLSKIDMAILSDTFRFLQQLGCLLVFGKLSQPTPPMTNSKNLNRTVQSHPLQRTGKALDSSAAHSSEIAYLNSGMSQEFCLVVVKFERYFDAFYFRDVICFAFSYCIVSPGFKRITEPFVPAHSIEWVS